MNIARPFLEGNGRSMRIWLRLRLSHLINVIREKTRAEFMKDALDVICVLEKAKQQNKFVILYDV